ncbi:hypothetical protein [Mucilaginibacter pedocola]|uniref:Uncharacterized protein n=1 Tax=Mucilaginibacter pedocola TaxID=1792845 RepID=A0A1S9PAX2_9SPHI|nr:hypothetical protein [Mucilaginibacter pedocola]OOQ57967.1 hypothetical protein BC343_09860 [Mucilaginibacter pedocola]
MKKIFAIAMLAVLMFNIGGYMLLFSYFIKHADDFANEQIAKGLYKPDELVEIKIPVSMPNIQQQSDFQAIAGQVKLHDGDYNYVAMKMTRDTMYLMCIPNYEKTRLIDQNIITAKNISDSPLAQKSHLPVVKKAGIDNIYNIPVALYTIGVNMAAERTPTTDLTENTSTAHLNTPAQPPEGKSVTA